jgi:dihydroneopterin aldolase
MVHKTIALEGLELKAHIGYYDEERLRGVDFIVDVSVEELWEESKNNDAIENTVNYEKIARIVETEMAKGCKLIEDAAHRIYEGIQQLDLNIHSIDIVIRKKNPPIQPAARFSKVELHWKH